MTNLLRTPPPAPPQTKLGMGCVLGEGFRVREGPGQSRFLKPFSGPGLGAHKAPWNPAPTFSCRPPTHPIPIRLEPTGLGVLARLSERLGSRGWLRSRGRERCSPRASRQSTRLSRNLETQGSRCHLRKTSSEKPVIKCFFPAPSPACGSPPLPGAARIKPGKIRRTALPTPTLFSTGLPG